ncbi:hypothetical protein HK405_002826, partial [Cladochytrium tenue]
MRLRCCSATTVAIAGVAIVASAAEVYSSSPASPSYTPFASSVTTSSSVSLFPHALSTATTAATSCTVTPTVGRPCSVPPVNDAVDDAEGEGDYDRSLASPSSSTNIQPREQQSRRAWGFYYDAAADACEAVRINPACDDTAPFKSIEACRRACESASARAIRLGSKRPTHQKQQQKALTCADTPCGPGEQC